MAFLVLCWTGAAQADPLPDGGVTASELAKVLQNAGYQAEVTTDKTGDPLVRSAANGAKFQIYFYECKGRRRCPSIQFASGFSDLSTTPTRIANWNRTKRFGRAYLDDDDNAWVEMDVDVEHGATTEALANDLERWVVTLSEFMKFVKA